MTKPPELVGATQEQIEELLALAKTTFPAQQYELLEGVLATFVYMMRALQSAKTSLKRFRKMLFGASTESARNLRKGASAGGDPAPANDPPPAKSTPSAEAAPPAVVEPKAKPAKPRVGHGRNGADKYSNSPVVHIDLSNLKSGDQCPECQVGKVYNAPPKTLVRVVGQPPLAATIYKLQHVRCRLCDATVTAPMPEGTSPSKYDASCASMLAVLRYGNGMPFYRLEGLQGSLNVPLPDSTQWQIVLEAVPAPSAVFKELTLQAAQGDVLHTDDTPGKILSLIVARNKLEAAGQTPEVKAINTSGIVSLLPEGNKVALFFTGHPHAGTNLSTVLTQRAKELGAPIQMSDALACNFVGEFARIIAKCLTHGRRKFVDVMEHFPQDCAHVIKVLGQIYAHDEHARDKKMSPGERLLYHKAHSAEPMQELKRWMNEQLDQHLVEPNSGLGQAITYMLKHWEGLTLFLRKEGAPLDNNICERALKRAIRHRKNSMFYWTANGARVGDIYMSLIHTCELCKVNPFEYLQALHTHAQDVLIRAALWLPWNYRSQLAQPAEFTISGG